MSIIDNLERGELICPVCRRELKEHWRGRSCLEATCITETQKCLQNTNALIQECRHRLLLNPSLSLSANMRSLEKLKRRLESDLEAIRLEEELEALNKSEGTE